MHCPNIYVPVKAYRFYKRLFVTAPEIHTGTFVGFSREVIV